MELNKIYLGDCLDLMSNIPDKSIDMICTDLPYGSTKNRWDIIIPFEPLWKHYQRIIKDDGAIVLFSQGLFTAKLMLSNEKWFRYDLIWKKGERTTGFLNSKKMPLRNHENILVFYKKVPTYNPQMSIGELLHSKGTKYKTTVGTNNNYGKFNNIETPITNLKYPKSVLNFEKPHPPVFGTQKPINLCEYLIKTYSNPDDVILDNCIGSGSTIIACINTGRRYIGMEKDETNFLLAKKRIENLK